MLRPHEAGNISSVSGYILGACIGRKLGKLGRIKIDADDPATLGDLPNVPV